MQELKQIQEENRKAVIMACNPEAKTYEEALEMELGFGCELSVNDNILCYINEDPVYNDEKPIFNKYTLEEVREISTNRFTKIDKFKLIGCNDLRDFKDVKIIGKPLTLNRVLVALSDKLYQMDIWQEVYITNLKFLTMSAFGGVRLEETVIFEWNLTKETLEEQSEETQRKINKLLI